MNVSKRELVDCCLNGEKPCRVPVGAWGHLLPDEVSDEKFAEASISFARKYDWDFIKVNNRATLFAEAWGNEYDMNDYDSVLARFVSSDIGTPPDISKIKKLDISSGVLGHYLEKGLRPIVKGLSDLHCIQTIFSPITTLAFIAGRPEFHKITEGNRSHAAALRKMVDEDPKGTHAALDVITDTLCEFAKASVDAGASGIFLAIMLLARDGVLSREEYNEFGKPYDQRIFEAVKDAPFNMLHICGEHSYFNIACDMPANAVSWGSIGQGNPTMAEARKMVDKVLISGVSEGTTMLTGTPEQVIEEAKASIIPCGNYKTMLAPGCCVWPGTPEANLYALRKAADLITFD